MPWQVESVHRFFPMLMLILAGGGLGQTPPPPAASNTGVSNPSVGNTSIGNTSIGNSRIYILLKPSVAQPGDAHDAFPRRMAELGVTNLQFVTGAYAARCEAPVSAQPSIAADADVTGVLPMDAATQATPPAGPPALPPPAVPVPVTPPPIQGPVLSTPPYMPPPQSIPISAGVPVGGGMNAGMTMLTDLAGTVVVKLLTPGSSCKIRVRGQAQTIPAAGGEGAFEVKASGNCAWQAVSTADWLHVKSEVNVAGGVAVIYTAARNPGGHRQAVVVIQPVAGMAPLKGHTVASVAQQ
jgi:hypothetical protein